MGGSATRGRESAKWLWLEDVFAGQLAQVTTARAECADTGEQWLLAFVLALRALLGVRCRLPKRMLKRLLHELWHGNAALGGDPAGALQ